MKILHICFSDAKAGAFLAAYKIHKHLQKLDVDSLFYVIKKQTSDPSVISDNRKVLRFKTLIISDIENHIKTSLYPEALDEVFSSNLFPGIKIPEKTIKDIDIIHLHWIGWGTISPKSIYQLNKPVVWRLPDMYAFTGGCHYSYDCNRYINQCGCCPILKSKHLLDLSNLQWKKKNKYFNKIKNMTIVTPSQWLQEKAKESSLFKDKNIQHIPTGVDISIFKPLEQSIARSILNINIIEDRFVLAFGGLGSNSRKGFSYLISSINFLISKYPELSEKLVLLIFGNSHYQETNIPIKTIYLGCFNDDTMLSLAYNAADLFICPSIQENLPNTALEALACGIPVIGFNVGGLSEIINHKVNGYLSKTENFEDLANGILWFIENNNFNHIKTNARQVIINNYDISKTTNQWIELYNKIITSRQ